MQIWQTTEPTKQRQVGTPSYRRAWSEARANAVPVVIPPEYGSYSCRADFHGDRIYFGVMDQAVCLTPPVVPQSEN
jgi:hypothetical protein